MVTQGRALKQRRIGLTGGIASGKSTVGHLLASQFGLPVLDADRFAREALAPGTAASATVLDRYGAAVLACPDAAAGEGPGKPQGQKGSLGGSDSRRRIQTQSQGPAASQDAGTGVSPLTTAPAIDRAALGRIIFADAAERQWLEALIHPLVRQRFSAELARLHAAPTVVLMIPLLFEAGLQDLCHEVWLVDCAPEQQLQRLRLRNGLTETEARARIAAQWPLERKRAMADRLIDNRGATEALVTQVAQHLKDGGRPESGTGS